jgi:hypothetical protein
MSLMPMLGRTEHVIEFIASVTSVAAGTTAPTLVIPAATARAGDLAVVFVGTRSSASILPTPALPTGFTSVNAVASNTAVGANIRAAYKILVAADIGATVTGAAGAGTGGANMTLLIFRSTKILTDATVTVTAGGIQATTATPTAQTVTPPVVSGIYFGHWCATAPITTRTSSLTMTEVAGASTAQYTKYVITNGPPATSVTNTIQTSDVGTNAMHNFFLNIA